MWFATELLRFRYDYSKISSRGATGGQEWDIPYGNILQEYYSPGVLLSRSITLQEYYSRLINGAEPLAYFVRHLSYLR